jgi:ribosomal protein S18 acetylase RimI-like enzyme
MTLSPLEIRPAETRDHYAIWSIIRQVIAAGDTYVFPPDSSREEMLGYWCGESKHCYVATLDDRVVGTFIIMDNQPGLGSHVANASFMTDPQEFGKGIGRYMGEYSLKEARRLGYLAMQFNVVVKSNERAVRLWQKLGFEIIGEAPFAFNSLKEGLTNAYIMWKRL